MFTTMRMVGQGLEARQSVIKGGMSQKKQCYGAPYKSSRAHRLKNYDNKETQFIEHGPHNQSNTVNHTAVSIWAKKAKYKVVSMEA